jgi:hypothetical protein
MRRHALFEYSNYLNCGRLLVIAFKLLQDQRGVFHLVVLLWVLVIEIVLCLNQTTYVLIVE